MTAEAWDELRAIADALGDVDASDEQEVGDAIDTATDGLRRIAAELEEEHRLRQEISDAPPLETPEAER